MIEQRDESWTAEMIGAAVREAFRLMKFTGIWTRSGNRHDSVGMSGIESRAFDIVAFSATVLGERSEERIALMAWGRLTAQSGEDVGSINEWCASMGWDKTTFWRRKNRACAKVAVAKNAADRRKAPGNATLPLDSATGQIRARACAGEQTGA